MDAASCRALDQARRFAASQAAILIRGENGVGKDLLAQIIHFHSAHSFEPLLRVDCASLPPETLEVELFGVEFADDGAGPRRGRLEMAGRGTLVLDEIAALPMPVQARLLQALEERRVQRLGGSESLPWEGRLVALTAVDLERAIARNSFREDLYHRLATAGIAVPPLRQRVADIRPLVKHLLALLGKVHRRPELEVAPEALRALEQYFWPGNVRELRNMLERALLQASSNHLLLSDLPGQVRCAAGAAQKKMSLEDMERAHIAEVLEYTRGKKTRAAQILGISRKTLLEKRKRYGFT